MKSPEIRLHKHLRRILYILAFISFLCTLLLFYLAVKSRENPIGAEVQLPEKDSLKRLPGSEHLFDPKDILFTVVNDSKFDWSGVRLTVNDMYVVEPGPILAGQAKEIHIADLNNINTVPTSIIPPNRSVATRLSYDRNDDITQQNPYYGLDSLNQIKIRTNSGRIIYKPKQNQYLRIGIDGQPTSFFRDLQHTF